MLSKESRNMQPGLTDEGKPTSSDRSQLTASPNVE